MSYSTGGGKPKLDFMRLPTIRDFTAHAQPSKQLHLVSCLPGRLVPVDLDLIHTYMQGIQSMLRLHKDKVFGNGPLITEATNFPDYICTYFRGRGVGRSLSAGIGRDFNQNRTRSDAANEAIKYYFGPDTYDNLLG